MTTVDANLRCSERKLRLNNRAIGRLPDVAAQCMRLTLLWLLTSGVHAGVSVEPGTGELRLRSLSPATGMADYATESEAGGVAWATAPQLGTKVEMDIDGLVARVTVEQRFRNNTADFVEGHYVFPLPETAAVNAMTMQIGERLIVGEIHEKEAAKQIYAQAKAAGKRTALTQQHRANLFSNKIANIAPGEEIRVTLTYLERVSYAQGRFSVRFPMTLTPRYIPGQTLAGVTRHGFSESLAESEIRTINPLTGWALATDRVPDAEDITPPQIAGSAVQSQSVNPAQISVRLNPGLALAQVNSAYHRIDVKQEDDDYHIVLSEGTVSMDRDFELSWQPIDSATPQAAVFSETVGDEQYVLLMVVPPAQLNGARRIPREVIFVIDTSGSMGGQSIEQARAALAQGLRTLHPEDRFNVIAFNHETRRLFGQAQVASGAYLQDALSFVRRLQADGGTEMAPAITSALTRPAHRNEHLRQVLFITDGAVGNEDALFRQISGQLGNSRLFTVGIGSAPNSHFMRKAARFGRGTFLYIGDADEVQGKMATLFSQLESPILQDIRVSWPGRTEAFPTRVPDLYQGEPLVLTARFNASTGYRDQGVAISGLTSTGDWQQRLRLPSRNSNSGVATLWARDKIAELEDRRTEAGETESLRSEITHLALLHRLASRYTAFVAVDKTPVRPQANLLKTQAVPNAQPAGQAMNSLPYPQTATNATTRLQLGLVCLAFAAQLWWLRRRDLQRAATGTREQAHA